MKNQDKISFAINQIPINNCDGSANEKAIKAVRYLQEVHEALSQDAVIKNEVAVCDKCLGRGSIVIYDTCLDCEKCKGTGTQTVL